MPTAQTLKTSWLGAAVLLLLAGCAAEPLPSPTESWFIAVAEDLPGVWESVAPQIAPDGAVLRTFYAFRADGTYEVVVVAYACRFVLLSDHGTWRPTAVGVDFVEDGFEPYVVTTFRGQRLRFQSGARTLELERVLDDVPSRPDDLLAMPPPLLR